MPSCNLVVLQHGRGASEWQKGERMSITRSQHNAQMIEAAFSADVLSTFTTFLCSDSIEKAEAACNTYTPEKAGGP